MRTSNPALNAKTFTGFGSTTDVAHGMSIQGTVNKTILLLLIALLAAGWTWNLYYATGNADAVKWWVISGAFGGLVVAIVTIYKKQWASVTAPIYALFEGFLLGGISAIFEAQFPRIVIQAVSLTYGIFFCLLLAYKSRLLQATQNFKLGVVSATGGIALFYLAAFFLGLFGIQIPFIHESGVIGIGFSLIVVIIAALNLVLDFDFIESGAAQGAAKYMEWYAAFGLMVTLIWLYVEILKLLAKIRRRR